MFREAVMKSNIVMTCVLAWSCPILAGAGVDVEAIDAALGKAEAYLWTQQQSDGAWPTGLASGRYKHLTPPQWKAFPTGPTALVAFALLEKGVTLNNEKLSAALKFLRTHPTHRTYSLAMRTHVWRLVLRQNPPGNYRNMIDRVLRQDTSQLLKNLSEKGYPYPWSDHKYHLPPYTDNSNTQLGLLGVWSASLVPELEIPRAYWQRMLRHWITTQRTDGGWGYIPEFNKPQMRDQERNDPGQFRSTARLTLAGVASLYICMDNALSDRYAHCRGHQPLKPLERGINWLEKDFRKSGPPEDSTGLFYLERVGLASGRRILGGVDWFDFGSRTLLAKQTAEGSFGNNIIDTAFGMLFLVRGRQPILVSKLEHPGDWRNRPRDLANLTRWVSERLEREVRWQIVGAETDLAFWLDSPILVITGEQPVTFPDELIETLRTYVYRGGTILSLAECNDKGFTDSMRKAYAKMFPRLELQPVPRSSELYRFQYPLPGRPRLRYIRNGVRPLAFHCADDLPKSWQLYRFATKRHDFQLMVNLAMYLTDKHLPERGSGNWPAAKLSDSGPTVARLRHGGNWNPEPLALTRWALGLRRRGKAVQLLGTLPGSDLPEQRPRLVVMTGTGPVRLNPDDLEGLRKYLQAGGTLLIDAAGGSQAFAKSARQMVETLVGSDNLRRAQADSFVYAALGEDGLKLRPESRKRHGGRPEILIGTLENRPAVVFSALDLTAGLLGLRLAGVDGYEPDTARRIVCGVLQETGDLPAAKPAARNTGGKSQPDPESKGEDDVTLEEIWDEME